MEWLDAILQFFGGGGDLYDTSAMANSGFVDPGGLDIGSYYGQAMGEAAGTAMPNFDWGFYPGFAPQFGPEPTPNIPNAGAPQGGQFGGSEGFDKAAGFAKSLSPLAALALAGAGGSSSGGSGGGGGGFQFPSSGGGAAKPSGSSSDTAQMEDIAAGQAPQFFASRMGLPLNDYLELVKKGQA